MAKLFRKSEIKWPKEFANTEQCLRDLLDSAARTNLNYIAISMVVKLTTF
jgi:hypothetical protein